MIPRLKNRSHQQSSGVLALRLLVIFTFVALVGLTLLVCAVQASGVQDMQVIRNSGHGTVVYKFQDGLNTCYVSESEDYALRYDSGKKTGGVTSSISCLKK